MPLTKERLEWLLTHRTDEWEIGEDVDLVRMALASLSRPEVGPRWIPVGERLPNPHSDNDYICATVSGHVTTLNFDEHGWCVYDGYPPAHDGYWNGCVTHWMPLPDAPNMNLGKE